MSIKINKLEIENVKRVKAVKIEPTANGLTVVGGRNNQGKTSVLDSIAWALGGNGFKPSDAQREGSVIPPTISMTLSNGLVVERKGKNSDLKVIDPTGKKGGQQLLNEFVEVLALDLPKFMGSNNKEKANTLLQIIGVGEQLYQLEQKEKEVYNQRHTVGQIADQKKKFADEQIYYPDAPKEPISASELIKQQQDILATNGENQRKRENLQGLQQKWIITNKQIEDLENQLLKLRGERECLQNDLMVANKSVAELIDQSTTELEASINNIEEINRKVRANLDKDKANDDAAEYSNMYNTLTYQLNNVRQAKLDLLKGADLPLPGLNVVDGELTYNGHKWDSMSGSDQLKVSVAIVRKLNPKCGFVLVDKLEQMDIETLTEFGTWLEQEGLQAIATRVSTGPECEIIIEDGYVKDNPAKNVETPKLPTKMEPATWKAGEF